MRRTFVIILYLFLGDFMLQAQMQNFRFERLSLEEGLSHSYVNDITQDRRGFVWIATYDGVNRFDGYEFENFSPTTDKENSLLYRNVLKIIEDKNGHLWFLYNKGNGISKYDPEKNIFDHFSSKKDNPLNLPSVDILNIFTDRDKNIWICTKRGVVKYLGNDNVLSKKYLIDDKSPVMVLSVKQDLEGDIWVNTSEGLFYLDENKDRFISVDQLLFNALDKNFNRGNTQILDFIFDRKGFVYLAFQTELLRVQASPLKNNQTIEGFYHLPIENDLSTHVQDKIVMKIDDKNRLWMGGTSGLWKIEPIDGSNHLKVDRFFTHYEGIFAKAYISSIHIDSKGSVWVGSADNSMDFGLRRYIEGKNEFEVYKNDKTNIYSLANNKVRVLFEDNNSVLWVGTSKGGVNKIDLYQKPFLIYQHSFEDSVTLLSNVVYAVFENSLGEVFFGTERGLSIYNPKLKSYTNYSRHSNGQGALQGLKIGCFLEDKHKIWMGFYDNQFATYDYQTKKFHDYLYDENEENPILGWSFRSIIKDRSGKIWLGNFSHGLLEQYDDHNFRSHQEYNRNGVVQKLRVWTLYETPINKEEAIWIGTFKNGLKRFDKRSKKFMTFTHDEEDQESIPSNNVRGILQIEKDFLWLTTEEGLCKFNVKTFKGKTYRCKKEFFYNNLHSILADNQGNLWISSNSGIVKFDPNTEQFSNYTVEDGLQSNEFHEVSRFQNRNGYMYFGGSNGVTYFHPDSISPNPFAPKPLITKVLLNGQELRVGDTINHTYLIKEEISNNSSLELAHNENDLTFYFTGLHFANPKANQYQYMLEGYDKIWKTTGAKNRVATYTNIDDGDYVFKVKASNHDGLWNEEPAILKISIQAPWWERTWFRTGLVVMIVLLGFLISNWRMRFLLARKKNLEKLVNEQSFEIVTRNKEIAAQNEELISQNDQLENLNTSILTQQEEIRSINESLEKTVEQRTNELNNTITQLNKTISELDRFVYSASHDLSAPLKSIKGIINLIKYDQVPAAVEEKISYIDKSVSQLESVITELTEFSRNSRMDSKISEVNFHQLIYDTYEELKYHRQDISIQFTIDIEKDFVLQTDALRLKIIIKNLLSNAVKYQDAEKPHHFIKVWVEPLQDTVLFYVQDNGLGIEKEFFDKIFDMFFRATELSKGSGLGLYIVKEAVAKINGQIFLESTYGQGTIFKVEIPKSESGKLGA